MREIEFIHWLYAMASSRPKGSDQGIKTFFTSSRAVAKTTGATSPSIDSVFGKGKRQERKATSSLPFGLAKQVLLAA